MRLTKPIAVAGLALASLLPSAGAQVTDCLLNTNPTCGSAMNLGTIAGDSDSGGILRTGTGEAFFVLRIQENSSASRALNARVVLHVPPQVDYDLIVRCTSCTSKVAKYVRQGIGMTETLAVTRPDTFVDNSFVIVIEVRHVKGTACGPWTLTINGNTAAAPTPLSCG